MEIVPSVNVRVDYYDDEHRSALQCGVAQKHFAPPLETFNISTAELFTYLLFYKKTANAQGYRSFLEISNQGPTEAQNNIKGLFDLSKGTINAIPGTNADANTLQHLGEAVGLAVASRIFKLTNADWTPIPKISGKNGKKTLDFETNSSTGNIIIVVENKGHKSKDNAYKDCAVSIHKKSILEKKEAQKLMPNAINRNNAMRLGTIACFDESHVARCWIVDPPEESSENPKHLKTKKRVAHLSKCISSIAPRSQLATALAVRANDLCLCNDIDKFNREPLVKNANNRFNAESIYANHSHTARDGFYGKCHINFHAKTITFFGIDSSFYNLSIEQDFERINAAAFIPSTSIQYINCYVPIEFPGRQGWAEAFFKRVKYNRRLATIPFVLFKTDSGMCFGYQSLNDEILESVKHHNSYRDWWR